MNTPVPSPAAHPVPSPANPASIGVPPPVQDLGREPRFARSWIALGCTLVCVGIVWMLATLGYLPEINWVWVLTLLALGMLPLGLFGLNKVTFILAGFFTSASIASVLVQTQRVELNLAIPAVIIAAGLATLLSMVFGLRTPDAMRKAGQQARRG